MYVFERECPEILDGGLENRVSGLRDDCGFCCIYLRCPHECGMPYINLTRKRSHMWGAYQHHGLETIQYLHLHVQVVNVIPMCVRGVFE
jgi:hypothetical protein